MSEGSGAPDRPRRIWPRGRWNGERIGGVMVRVEVNVFWWALALGSKYAPSLHVGPLHIWWGATYEHL